MSHQSIQAYIEAQPTIKPTESKILHVLERLTCADLKTLAKESHLTLQTCSARLSEMHDKGYVTQLPSGQYIVLHEDHKDNVIAKRLNEKYERWKKLGEKHNWHFRYETFDKHGEPPQPKHYE